jgi:RimJ/RimL family protein N-acetyltransferase
LRLAPITMADADRLAVLHADHRVMQFLKHGALNRQQSDAMVADYEAEWAGLGFGSWTAVELATGQLVGYGGLRVHDRGLGIALRAAFVPEAQGMGYGPELGRASIDFAFDIAGADRVSAVTRDSNNAGRRSLEKLGMVLEKQEKSPEGVLLCIYVALKSSRGG